MPVHFSLTVLAAVVYGLSRSFSRAQGDYSPPDWDVLRQVERNEWVELFERVQKALHEDKPITDQGLFEFWSERRIEAGWKPGVSTSRDNLTHRWLVKWEALPDTERLRWSLIHANAIHLLTSECAPQEEAPDVVADRVDEFLAQEAAKEKQEQPLTKKGRKPKS